MRLLLVLLAATFASCSGNAARDANLDEPDLTKPENAARWESGRENVFKSKIAVVTLAKLHGSLAGDEKPQAVAVEVCGSLADGVSAEQQQALELLVKDEAELHAKVREAIYRFYKESYPDYEKAMKLGARLFGGPEETSKILPKVRIGNELDRLVTFQKIFVHRSQGGPASIGFELDCPWDEEHGLGVLISGDGTVKAGLAEIAYP